MIKEFNLSEKINDFHEMENQYQDVIPAKYVKEFIRLLKEEIENFSGFSLYWKDTLKDAGRMRKNKVLKIIDKLAGEKLK
ncbi:MAG: hypothetical protein EHM20_02010 [Alphaproteobacteria bacterium]|nr:MAG: hypothetical protein EHM20_02010 [Alphaproteobacteria bacterium]